MPRDKRAQAIRSSCWKGRRCALAMGLRVHGTLGIVIESYRLGKLTDPRATMLELRANGMWISDAVIERALQIAMRHE